MDVKDILIQKRETILKKWFELILESYPADVASFLRLEKDTFANPVGHIFTQGTEILYDEIVHDTDSDRIISALDSIIRVRAVQDFMPSQAIAFVFLLKQALRKELQKETHGDELYRALFHYEAKVDMMALMAFDVYTRCKQEIHNIKSGEIRMERDMAMKLFKMFKQIDKE